MIDDGDMAYDAWKQDHEHKIKVPMNYLSEECEDSRCNKVCVFDTKQCKFRWMYKHEAYEFILEYALGWRDKLNDIDEVLNA